MRAKYLLKTNFLSVSEAIIEDGVRYQCVASYFVFCYLYVLHVELLSRNVDIFIDFSKVSELLVECN